MRRSVVLLEPFVGTRRELGRTSYDLLFERMQIDQTENAHNSGKMIDNTGIANCPTLVGKTDVYLELSITTTRPFQNWVHWLTKSSRVPTHCIPRCSQEHARWKPRFAPWFWTSSMPDPRPVLL